MYEVIVARIFSNICLCDFSNKEYILRSSVNTIAVCLKDLCDSNKNLPTFTSLVCTHLFPNFHPNANFMDPTNPNTTLL